MEYVAPNPPNSSQGTRGSNKYLGLDVALIQMKEHGTAKSAPNQAHQSSVPSAIHSSSTQATQSDEKGEVDSSTLSTAAVFDVEIPQNTGRRLVVITSEIPDGICGLALGDSFPNAEENIKMKKIGNELRVAVFPPEGLGPNALLRVTTDIVYLNIPGVNESATASQDTGNLAVGSHGSGKGADHQKKHF